MSEEERPPTSAKQEEPLDILSEMANKEIFIRLVDKTELAGRLTGFDQFMNLKMDVEGEEVLIRGNNVMLIATDWQDLRRPEPSGSS